MIIYLRLKRARATDSRSANAVKGAVFREVPVKAFRQPRRKRMIDFNALVPMHRGFFYS